MRKRIIAIGALLGLGVSLLILAQSGNELFNQARALEADGKYEDAIKLYQQITQNSPADKQLMARTLIRLGGCYELLGNAKGQEFYQRVLNEFPEQADMVREANIRLESAIKLQAKNNMPRRIDTPFTSDPYSFAISPDGQKLVYIAAVDGKTALWLHDLKSGKTAPIPGTESDSYGPTMGGAHPFWSPDSKAIGFFVEGKLKRIDAAGGDPVTIADAPYNYGGSWNRDNVIIFVRDNLNAVYRVSATGGVPQRITELNGANVSHRFPQFLPDDRHFLFYRVDLRNTPQSSLGIGSLDSSQVKGLSISLQAMQSAYLAPPDQLLVVAQRTLYAQHLDTVALEVAGARAVVTEQVADFRSTATPGYAAVSVSKTGSVAYRAKDTFSSQLYWYDRQGKQIVPLAQPAESATIAPPRLSPDGRTVAVVAARSDGAYVRLIDTKDGSTRNIFVADVARFRWDTLAWSPDGESLFIAMTVPGFGNTDVYRRTISGSALERFTNINGNESIPSDTSSDGKYLLYTFGTGNSRMDDLRTRRLSDGTTLRIATNVRPGSGRFSPDSRWFAYEEGGPMDQADQICIRSLSDDVTAPPRISFKGHAPQWSSDGRELYFVSADNRLMAVSIKFPEGGGYINMGEATSLFALPQGATYTPAEGQRFLVNVAVESAPPIYIVSDWTRSMPAAPVSINPSTSATPATDRVISQQFIVLDRRGNPTARIGAPYSGASGSVTLSPDGTQIATIRNGELSVTDIATNVTRRVAMDAIQVPVWSGDGRRLAYISDRSADPGIYFGASNGERTEEWIYRGVGNGKATNLWNWSADGRFVAATIADRIRVLTITTGSRPNPITIGPAAGKTGFRLSPHGDFLAYISDEIGMNQIFIRSFDPNDLNGYTQRQVTTIGAVGMIRWRADGQELYYLDPRGSVMAVPITTSPQFRAGTPVQLFHAPPGFVVDTAISDSVADVSADGQRFIFVVASETKRETSNEAQPR